MFGFGINIALNKEEFNYNLLKFGNQRESVHRLGEKLL